MYRATLLFGALLLVALPGCRKSEKDYIGTYVHEPTSGNPDIVQVKRRTLEITTRPGEIKEEYIWKHTTEFKGSLHMTDYATGTWEVLDGKIVLNGGSGTFGWVDVKVELKGDKLLDHTHNRIYIKQD